MTLADALPTDPSSGSTAAGDGGGARAGEEHHRIVIVGTGFAGLGMAVRLLQEGEDDLVLLERDDGPGGTWRANTYPGCQCDVPSVLYSLSFAPNPDWTTTYPLQPELRRYLEDVADRFGVTPHIRYRTPMLDASWDGAGNRWVVTTPATTYTADELVLAAGGLAEPSIPDLPGLDGFEGAVFHSARWDHDHDLQGERVAVVGTGASAIQIVPAIQPEVDRLDLYQRSPAWVVPHPDRPTTERERRRYRRHPWVQRLKRAATYAALEVRVLAFAKVPRLMHRAGQLTLRQMRRQVGDPELAETLTPHYEMGCKRVLISSTYYPAVAQPNVDVVTTGIGEVIATGIVDEEGVERPVDTIVLATGFRVTDSPTYQLVHGRDGRSLGDAFLQRGAYKGTTCRGFPNLYVMAGPNTGIGHTSLVFMIESQIRYVLDALRTKANLGLGTVEPKADAQDAWWQQVQRDTQGTVWASGCQSWYLDADGRNGAIWPGFTFRFRRLTRHFDPDQYDLTPARRSIRA